MGRSRVGEGQEQGKCRAKAGAGLELGRNRVGEQSRAEQDRKRAEAGQKLGSSWAGASKVQRRRLEGVG